jgi:hypothetical protein
MAKQSFSLGTAQGPFAASLEMTGGLPFAWELYLYQQDPAGTWTRVGPVSSGKSATPAAVPGLAVGNELCWSVNAINLGPRPEPVKITASLLAQGGVPIGSVTEQLTLSRAQPSFLVTVAVVA